MPPLRQRTAAFDVRLSGLFAPSDQTGSEAKMTTDSLRERGQSLEEAFFLNMDRELIEGLRAKKEREQQIDELAAASGIAHRAVLGALLDAGVHSEVLVAVGLAPLIEVAWADHTMDAGERDAILRAAKEAGVTEGAAAAGLLSAWLEQRPGAELLEGLEGLCRGADSRTRRGGCRGGARGHHEPRAGRCGGRRRLSGAGRGVEGRAAHARRAGRRAYQLALMTPGSSPRRARSRSAMRERPNLR